MGLMLDNFGRFTSGKHKGKGIDELDWDVLFAIFHKTKNPQIKEAIKKRSKKEKRTIPEYYISLHTIERYCQIIYGVDIVKEVNQFVKKAVEKGIITSPYIRKYKGIEVIMLDDRVIKTLIDKRKPYQIKYKNLNKNNE